MFRGCDALETIDLDINLASVTTTANMFNEDAKLKNIRFTNNDAPALTNMSYMFRNCASLEEIRMPGLIGAAVTNMNSAFQGCESLKVLDLENFLASEVTDGTSLFEKCKSLEILRLGFNSKLTKMNNMFNDCPNLIELSLSNLDTSGVADMSYAFANNSKLEKLTLGNNFSTSNVTNFSYMFTNSPKLPIPYANLDLSIATNIEGMFQNHPLTQDDLTQIAALNTSQVANMNNLFNGCDLPEIADISGMDMTGVTSVTNIFANNPRVKQIKVDNVKYNPDTNMSGLLTSMLSLPNMETIDFTNAPMYMSSSHSTNNYPNTITIYQGYTKLKNLILPGWNLRIHCPANVFPDSPLEVVKLGYLYSGWSHYEYNRFEYRGFFKNKKTLREVEVLNMNFEHAKSN